MSIALTMPECRFLENIKVPMSSGHWKTQITNAKKETELEIRVSEFLDTHVLVEAVAMEDNAQSGDALEFWAQ